MLAEHVRENGFEVLEASNVEDALAVARNHKIDLLVSDIVMPGGSGQNLATMLAASHPGIAVIFMSGYADDGAIRQALDHPKYVTFVQKPFTLRLMTQKIREVLGGRTSVVDSPAS
jgi:DNA-binding NtrC family response regulator